MPIQQELNHGSGTPGVTSYNPPFANMWGKDFQSRRYKPRDTKIVEPTERDAWTVKWIDDQYRRYEDYHAPDIDRIYRNFRMYWGINHGQWPAYVVEKLRTQGRRAPTYNIVADKIETLVGSFLSNSYDMRFMATKQGYDDLSMILQEMFLSDKEHMDWEWSEVITLLNMFITVGYERMVISDEYSDYGNIAWRPVDPTKVMLDPGWRSGKVSDIRNYITYNLMTPQEIADAYPRISEHLAELAYREYIEGIDYGHFRTAVEYRSLGEKWGDRHKVIEVHKVINVERKWEYDIKNNIPFPETGFKNGSDEDRAVKLEYIRAAGLDPNSDIAQVDQTVRRAKIKVCAPSLDRFTLFFDGDDQIQTNNINLYPVGMQRNGQFAGIVDRIYDLQLSVNRNEMNIDDIHQRSAKGAFILDSALAGGDPRLKEEIETNWNDAAARIWVDEGSTANLPNAGITPLPSAEPRPELFQQVDRRYDLADRFSKVPAAQEARTEHSGESGVLFSQKLELATVGQKYYSKIWEIHKKEKAKAYVIQAKITYGGMPRNFMKPGGKGILRINERYSQKEMNAANNILLLPPMVISARPSRTGVNVRTMLRTQYGELLQYIQDPNDRLLKLVLLNGILDTIEMPDEDREEVRASAELLKQQAAMAVAGNIQQMEMALQQAEAQAQQIQSAAAQATPAGDPGNRAGATEAPDNFARSQYIEPETGTAQQQNIIRGG